MTLLIMAMPYPKLLFFFFFFFLLHPLFSSGDLTPPNTIFPTTPISTTPFVTVPATNPVTITPTNPANTPLPLSNPVMSPPAPATVTNPAMAPPAPAALTNPAMAPPAPATLTNPAMAPPATTNGQSWCVVKSGAPESSVQAALDYACGIGGADCAQIQQSGSCYNPITLQNHASFAFNSYYQKHPSPSSCDFGGTATLTNTNPSTGSCIFPLSSSSSSSPSLKPPPTPSITPPSTPSIPPPSTTSIPPPSTTSIPPPTFSTPPQISTPITTPTPTPSTSSSSGAGAGAGAGVSGSGTPPMPMILNSSDPTSGTPTVFGSEVPPSVNTTTSISATLQPVLACIFVVTSFATQIIIQ